MENIVLKNIYNEEVILQIVDNENEADFITHSGTFHADEVMSTVILLNKFKNIKLFRTNNVTKNDAFIYDIGFGKYDHHASSFDEKRKIAGIGITIIDGQKQRTFSNWTKCRTNNAGELFAIYVSGILAEQRGVVYSDGVLIPEGLSYYSNVIGWGELCDGNIVVRRVSS